MPTTPGALAKKLGIKKDMRALIVNAPHGYINLLAPLPEGAIISHIAKGSYAFVQLFASRKSEIMKSAPALLKLACPNALVWIAYPKKTSGAATDLSRDEVRETAAHLSWRTVSIISIDSTWSALRIRPEHEGKLVSPSQSGEKL